MEAIGHYSDIRNLDLKKELLTNSYFNLIVSIAKNHTSDFTKVMNTIEKITKLGLIPEDVKIIPEEWKVHFSQAFFNVGITQKDPESKLDCFYYAKYYDQKNIEAIYCLGLVYMAQGKNDAAAKEFGDLLSLNDTDENLGLKLNSWCQLKKCLSTLDKDILGTLKSAWEFVKTLPSSLLTKYESEVSDIYTDYIIKNPKLDESAIKESVDFLQKLNQKNINDVLKSLDNEAGCLLEKDGEVHAELIVKFIQEVESKVVGEYEAHPD